MVSVKTVPLPIGVYLALRIHASLLLPANCLQPTNYTFLTVCVLLATHSVTMFYLLLNLYCPLLATHYPRTPATYVVWGVGENIQSAA